MPNRSYITGRQFEFLTRQWLERNNYFVMRSAGSHSTFDIAVFPLWTALDIGLDKTNPFVIQIKGLNFITLCNGNNLKNYLCDSRELNSFRDTKFSTTLFKKYLFIYNTQNKRDLPMVLQYDNLSWHRIDGNSTVFDGLLESMRISGQ